VFHEVSTECPDLSKEAVANWNAKLPSIVDGYEPKDFTNGDKIGVFFHVLPSKTLCLKSSDGKVYEQRLTVFLCGVMTGVLEKPLVTWKVTKQ
jgi:hypothetical protein